MQQPSKTESCFRVCPRPVELRALQGKRYEGMGLHTVGFNIQAVVIHQRTGVFVQTRLKLVNLGTFRKKKRNQYLFIT